MFELMNSYNISIKATVEAEDMQEGVHIHKDIIAENQEQALINAVAYLEDYIDRNYEDYDRYNIVSITINSVLYGLVLNVTPIVNDL